MHSRLAVLSPKDDPRIQPRREDSRAQTRRSKPHSCWAHRFWDPERGCINRDLQVAWWMMPVRLQGIDIAVCVQQEIMPISKDQKLVLCNYYQKSPSSSPPFFFFPPPWASACLSYISAICSGPVASSAFLSSLIRINLGNRNEMPRSSTLRPEMSAKSPENRTGYTPLLALQCILGSDSNRPSEPPRPPLVQTRYQALLHQH